MSRLQVPEEVTRRRSLEGYITAESACTWTSRCGRARVVRVVRSRSDKPRTVYYVEKLCETPSGTCWDYVRVSTSHRVAFVQLRRLLKRLNRAH